VQGLIGDVGTALSPGAQSVVDAAVSEGTWSNAALNYLVQSLLGMHE